MKTVEELKQMCGFAKIIEESNKNFQNLSDAKKRVAIAKDALEQVLAKKYKVKTGQYVTFLGSGSPVAKSEELDVPVACNLQDVKCQVCARGALFVSALRKDASIGPEYISNDENLGNDDIQMTEDQYFSREQLDLIESAFEVDQFCDDAPEEMAMAAELYGRSLGNKDERLVAILKNIIRNKGEFVIPEKFIKAGEEKHKKEMVAY